MEINAYKTKLKLLFDKLLQNKFKLNTYYVENLTKCLENNSDKDVGKLLETPFFSDLILYALSNIEKTSQSVKIFVMNLLTLVMKNELQFTKLLQLKGFYLMTDGPNVTKQDVSSPAFRMACIKQATVLIQHCSGLGWIMEHNIWRQIFNSCYENQPNYVLKTAYNFLSSFIWKLNETGEEANLMIVLETIVKPVVTSDYKNTKHLTSDMEDTLIAQVKPSIMTLLAVLDTEDISKMDKAVHLLARYFVIEAHLYWFVEITRDRDFAALTSQLNFLFASSSAAVLGLRNLPLGENELSMEGIAYFNIMHTLIQKRMTSVLIDFAVNSVLFWSKFGKLFVPSTFQRYGRTFVIDMQLIIILLVPFVSFTEKKNPFVTDPNDEDGMANYMLKLVEISSELMTKVCYSFKTLVEESDKREVVILTVRQITRLKGQLNNEQASTIFQALFYVLKYHVPTDSSGALVLTENKIKSVEDARLLSLVMELTKMLLKEHDINWYDSCEVVCLYNIIMNLLKPKTLPTKLVIQALDLINITVKKFLSPDLTLLMESKSGSALNEIGDTIKLSLGDSEWEVRDSALHLLLTCTELSFVKYTPFQKLISSNDLISEAARVACRDPQPYAQAAALKCLAAASRLPCIWKRTLEHHPTLHIDLAHIVHRHSEGIVRKEAVIALTEIFISQKVNDKFKRLIYCIMYNAALNDLHWEVQLAALTFWKKAIQTQLSNRGMIDGKFPSVTFSKEKRKIITLNQEEIKRQLASILNELALIGCLTVLNNCMSEDVNLKVMEQAHAVANELIEMLKRYNFTRVPESTIYFPVSNTNVEMETREHVPMDLSYYEYESVERRDQVIDSILKANQTDLIEKLYDNYVEIKMEKTEEEMLRNISGHQVMDPNQFLDNFRNSNFHSVIEGKRKWNSGVMNLNSLLDEVLSLDGGPKLYIDADCS